MYNQFNVRTARLLAGMTCGNELASQKQTIFTCLLFGWNSYRNPLLLVNQVDMNLIYANATEQLKIETVKEAERERGREKLTKILIYVNIPSELFFCMINVLLNVNGKKNP